MSATSTARAVDDRFGSDRPDLELHELPQVCDKLRQLRRYQPLATSD